MTLAVDGVSTVRIGRCKGNVTQRKVPEIVQEMPTFSLFVLCFSLMKMALRLLRSIVPFTSV